MRLSQQRHAIWQFAAAAALVLIAFAGKRLNAPTRSGAGAAAACVPDESFALQLGRAGEPGRGRAAISPWQMPWTAWKDILWRTYGQISEDRLLAVAAGVVFYTLLALFPAVTAFVSLYGLFAQVATIPDHLSLASGFVPGAGIDIINEQIARLAAKGNTKLGLGFAAGVALALWSSNAGIKAVIDALNVIYEEREKRGFVMLNLTSLAFTLGGILALLVGVAAVVVLPLFLAYVGMSGPGESLLRVLRWPALFVLIVIGLELIYRFGPSRREARWRWLTVGSLLAATLWLIGSLLLSWYLENFAHYDITYGSLGAGIALMMWLWMSSIVILLGAELNSEIEHQTARDSTIGAAKPLGARGAQMADTVGAAHSGSG